MDDAAMWERIMQLTPLRRWAEPDEIAEWVYFVGVTNRFMTGQNLLIDGGEAGAAEFVWPGRLDSMSHIPTRKTRSAPRPLSWKMGPELC